MKGIIGVLLASLLAVGCGSTPPPQDQNAPPPTTKLEKGTDGTEMTTTTIPDGDK